MWISGLQIKLTGLESLLLKTIALAFLIKSSSRKNPCLCRERESLRFSYFPSDLSTTCHPWDLESSPSNFDFCTLCRLLAAGSLSQNEVEV